MTKEQIRSIIGENIRRERIARDITIEEFAEILDVTPGFITLIERGRRGVTPYNLLRISEILQLSTDKLMQKRSRLTIAEKNPLKVQCAKISTMLYGFDEKELEFIILFLSGLRNMKRRNVNSKMDEDGEDCEDGEDSDTDE